MIEESNLLNGDMGFGLEEPLALSDMLVGCLEAMEATQQRILESGREESGRGHPKLIFGRNHSLILRTCTNILLLNSKYI